MCGMCKVIAYGYKRSAADLAPLGASATYIDHDKRRRERADMIANGIRRGDVVRVLYLRDLGGSPVADVAWRERIEALGATVEEHRPEKPPGVMGRPREFDPPPDQDEAACAVWLDETRSLADRERAVRDITGLRPTRFTLYRRYGKPGAPRDKKEPRDG